MMMAQFWHKGYYYPRPPFVPTVCQKIMIFTRLGGLGLLLPWSLTNSGLWPHQVALQWQSGKQMTKWLPIGKIDPNLG